MGCLQSAPYDSSDALVVSCAAGVEVQAEEDAGFRNDCQKVNGVDPSAVEPAEKNSAVFDSFLDSCALFSGGAKSCKSHLLRRSARKGQSLTTAGDACTSLLIVAHGTVDVCRIGGQNFQLGPGSIIDAVGFHFGTLQSVSAEASSDSVLLCELTRAHYEDQKRAIWLKPLKHALEFQVHAHVLSKLGDAHLLCGIRTKTLIHMSKIVTVEICPKSHTIFQEGQHGDGYYILGEGQLVVTLGGVDRQAENSGLDVIVLKELGAGDSFGEMSLLERKPRTATVTALCVSELLRLSKPNFEELLQRAPEVQEELKARISERNEVIALSKAIPFMKDLGPNTLHHLASVTSHADFAPGQVVLTQGQRRDQKYYLLIGGSVTVAVDGNVINTLDQRGDYFGELALVSDKPSSATVTAGPTGARCVCCTKKAFLAAFKGEDALFAEVAIRVQGEQVELEHILKHPASRSAFIKHCKKEYATESIDFYLACEHIEHLGRQRVRRDVLEALGYDVEHAVQARSEELEQKARFLVNKFIRTEADLAINIKAETRTALENKAENGEYSYDMFADAKHAVYTLLSRDSYSRFQETQQFKDLLESLCAYRAVDPKLQSKVAKRLTHFGRGSSSETKQDINQTIEEQIVG